MDADGDERRAILLAKLRHDFVAFGAVGAVLSGELLEENGALRLYGLDFDVTLVGRYAVAAAHDKGCCSKWYYKFINFHCVIVLR